MALVTARFRDKSNEYSTFSVHVEDIDGIARLWTTLTDETDDLETAVEGISLATLVSIHVRQIANVEDDTIPASFFAERESGLRFFYSDNDTAQKYNITIPAPDLDTIAVEGSDEVPLDNATVAPMVTWLEAEALSPNGNAVTVDRIVKVGRNN